MGLLLWVAVVAADEVCRPPGDRWRSKKLNSMVGSSDMKVTNRFTPDAKPFIGRVFDHTRWSENRQFLISDQWVLLPVGWLPKLIITSWDPITGQYRETNVLPNATYVNILFLGGEKQPRYTESEKDGHVTRTWATIESERGWGSELTIETRMGRGRIGVSSRISLLPPVRLSQ